MPNIDYMHRLLHARIQSLSKCLQCSQDTYSVIVKYNIIQITATLGIQTLNLKEVLAFFLGLRANKWSIRSQIPCCNFMLLMHSSQCKQNSILAPSCGEESTELVLQLRSNFKRAIP